jgi:hypothetical protein
LAVVHDRQHGDHRGEGEVDVPDRLAWLVDGLLEVELHQLHAFLQPLAFGGGQRIEQPVAALVAVLRGGHGIG